MFSLVSLQSIHLIIVEILFTDQSIVQVQLNIVKLKLKQQNLPLYHNQFNSICTGPLPISLRFFVNGIIATITPEKAVQIAA